MNPLWIRIRLFLAVMVIFIVTMGLARLFSGPEDDWIKNERGEWVAHGHPAGPPIGKVRRSPVETVLPWVFFVSFAAPLFFLGKHRPSNRLTFETVLRDMRFFGYAGSALVLLGTLTVVGIGAIVVAADSSEGSSGGARFMDLLFLGLLAGWAGLCLLVGVILFGFRRMVNDHYQLERGRREALEALERPRSVDRNP